MGLPLKNYKSAIAPTNTWALWQNKSGSVSVGFTRNKQTKKVNQETGQESLEWTTEKLYFSTAEMAALRTFINQILIDADAAILEADRKRWEAKRIPTDSPIAKAFPNSVQTTLPAAEINDDDIPF